MKIPSVDSCCCGCSLRFGAIVIGFIFSIACLSQTITLSILAENMANCMYCYDYESRGAVIAQAVVSAILLFTNILLFWGAIQNKANLIKPWLTIYTVIITIELIFGIFIVIVYFMDSAANGFYALLTVIVAFSFIFYCMMVVNSYYRKLTAPVLHRHPQFVGQVYAGGVIVQPTHQVPYNPHIHGQGYPQMQGQGYPQMQGQGYPQVQGQGYPQMQPPLYPPAQDNFQQTPPPKY